MAQPSAALNSGAGAFNASILADRHDPAFVERALAMAADRGPMLLLSNTPALGRQLRADAQVGTDMLGFAIVPIQFDIILKRIEEEVRRTGARLVVVDMAWGLQTVSAAANFESWGAVCDALCLAGNISVVSIYDTNLAIEDQLLAALRVHSHFLAPSGLYDNPYWLPPAYLQGATLTEQIIYLMQRLVPDYGRLDLAGGREYHSASGADPKWLPNPRRVRPRTASAQIWKIRCFGRLRVYRDDGSQIRWDLPGSAPKKSKALFAYLLQCGERGAPAERLAELLWPEEPEEEIKRRRLHHAVAMLRKALGGRQFLVRNGDYYRLVPPPGSWIDLASFEQLCNRAKTLARAGQDADAIVALDAATQLYSGDLFEDISADYLDPDLEDWLGPRRSWLREMVIKVHRDKAEILRRAGRLREALECCQRALEMDPISETAHAEAMRIFHAQGRYETVTRQYRQYLANLESMGLGEPSRQIEELSVELAQPSEKK